MKSLFYSAIFIMGLLIVGCESVSPLIKEAESQFKSQNYSEALAAADQAIAENPGDGLAHYYRGVTLASMGEMQEEPANRRDFYADSREAFMTASAIFDTLEKKPDQAATIETVITSAWASEHNSAVELLTVDSIAAEFSNPDARSIDHLINAITLAPDSVVSHSVMASAYYRMGDMSNAITSYETVMELLGTPEVDDYEFMISLYLADERYDDARAKSMQALELYPDVTTFVQYLADSYLQTGDTDKAIELVRQLIQTDPTNAQYRLVLGTQVYQTVSDLTEEFGALITQAYDLNQSLRGLRGSEKADVEARLDAVTADAEALEARINELTGIALEEIKMASDLMPEDPNPLNILGIIYQNQSALVFDKRNNTADYDLADQYDAEAREILQSAREYYERAVELDPDNQDYWRSLFQVYTTLGMTEKAEEAMQKAGM